MLKRFLLPLMVLFFISSQAKENIEYTAALDVYAGSGEFAPYMLSSWNSGRAVNSKGIWQRGLLNRNLNLDKRFSWAYGLEYNLGYGSGASYMKYGGDEWFEHSLRQSPARLIQLYGMVKFRSVYLLAGMKERHSLITDSELSSGDLIRSTNARPVPGVAAGFLDFVDIPFTKGWVQIDGEIMYGRMTDDGFDHKQFNDFQGLIASDLCYTYKRCYFRTNPRRPFSVTVGMQTAGLFGGSSRRFEHGKVIYEENRGFHIKDLWEMFFPREGSGENYYKGGSLGSWDFKATYTFNSGIKIDAYFQWPWEDGSGIGRRNGWDGLWGLQLSLGQNKILEKAVVEYLDFTNQSGPVHLTPGDAPGTNLSAEANGGDNYFNNDFYGPYANYGMAIGTPFLLSPRYNTDGYPEFAHNRARGFHAAACGTFLPGWKWTAKISYQKAGGQGRIPASRKLHDTSAMLKAQWCRAAGVNGLDLSAALALDHGNLRGNCVGAHVSVSYSGLITLGAHK